MSEQHTPGPWYVRGCELIGDSTILATLCWHSGREAENAADYALISAAPDLLEALKRLRAAFAVAVAANVDIEGFDPSEHVLIKQADAALSKASSPQAQEGKQGLSPASAEIAVAPQVVDPDGRRSDGGGA